MEPGYEVAPVRLGRRTWPRYAAPVAVAVVLVVVALAIAKPWSSAPDGRATIAADVADSADPSITSPPPALATAEAATPATDRPTVSWPATPDDTHLDGWVDGSGSAALGELAVHAGEWGVGTAGAGNRFADDSPRVDWDAVEPGPTEEDGGTIAIWPGTGICAGVVAIDDRPRVIALTAPSIPPATRRISGWWNDGGRIASLDGSIREVSSIRVRGIAFLERVDQAVWPAGRYAFELLGDAKPAALTVCLRSTD